MQGKIEECAIEVLQAFELWQAAKEYATSEGKRTLLKLKAAQAALKEAVEAGRAESGGYKLERVECCWQDVEEAKAERREVRSACRDAVSEALDKMRAAVDAAKPYLLSE